MSMSLKSWRDSAAEGWDGDRYYLVKLGERDALVWASIWDSSKDRAECETSLLETLGERGMSAVAVAKEDRLLVAISRDADGLGDLARSSWNHMSVK